MTKKANDIQIGGDHYQSEYGHWDMVLDLKLTYLQGCATKYITRWRNKDGIEGLQKAGHYCQKMKETFDPEDGVVASAVHVRIFEYFCAMNNLTSKEKLICSQIIFCRNGVECIDSAISGIHGLISDAQSSTQRPEPARGPGVPASPALPATAELMDIGDEVVCTRSMLVCSPQNAWHGTELRGCFGKILGTEQKDGIISKVHVQYEFAEKNGHEFRYNAAHKPEDVRLLGSATAEYVNQD